MPRLYSLTFSMRDDDKKERETIMKRKPRLGLVLLGFFAALGLLSGCVERRYTVITDPPGAMVFENHKPLGPAPADSFIVYPGKYNLTIVKDGYQTLNVTENFKPRWYDYWPLDFFMENVWPWTIHDVRQFKYALQPLPIANPEETARRGQMLRDRSQTIGGHAPIVTPRPSVMSGG